MADNLFTPRDWINRAKSNFILGTAFNTDNLPENLFLEDLCFELQQCVEKAIKAILVYSGIDFPKTHDISELLKIIKRKTTINIPDNIVLSAKLTSYAVKTRYPNWNKITVEEYKEAIEIARNTLSWVEDIIDSNK